MAPVSLLPDPVTLHKNNTGSVYCWDLSKFQLLDLKEEERKKSQTQKKSMFSDVHVIIYHTHSPVVIFSFFLA